MPKFPQAPVSYSVDISNVQKILRAGLRDKRITKAEYSRLAELAHEMTRLLLDAQARPVPEEVTE